MAQVLDNLARLLAPILVFTTDEAWAFAGKPASVHLELFPEADARLRDSALEAQVEELLKLRGIIAQAIEPARQAKEIGNALEGAVTLQLADEALLASLQGRSEELEEFFILSDLTIVGGSETSARVVRTTRAKCARCWRHRETVGSHPEQPELCDRCASVVLAS
jgi:isoleucyl-tRNA synthetase